MIAGTIKGKTFNNNIMLDRNGHVIGGVSGAG
jgi:hypothetical protein